MEQILNKPIIGKRINDVTKETLKYIDDRRKGNIISLKTRWKKFNENCFFEPNMIYTIAGTSGTGKIFLNILETNYRIIRYRINKYDIL